MKFTRILLAISLLVLFGLGFYYGVKGYNFGLLTLPNSFFGSRTNDDGLVQKLEKLMDLPQDEEPAITSLDNLEKLKNQQFFKKAIIGDKVVIYPKAKRAILYRPSENKIIDVGVVNINSEIKQDIPVLPIVGPTPKPDIEQEKTSTISATFKPASYPNSTFEE